METCGKAIETDTASSCWVRPFGASGVPWYARAEARTLGCGCFLTRHILAARMSCDADQPLVSFLSQKHAVHLQQDTSTSMAASQTSTGFSW